MRCFLGLVFVLLIFVDSGTSECDKYEFPCENGECIIAEIWCDGSADCSDGSDEKYCKKTSWTSGSDPNKCPSTYFKCNNGPCIPKIGLCDGYNNCEDKSDEKKCPKLDGSSNGEKDSFDSKSEEETDASTTSKSTKSTTTTATSRPRIKSEGSDNFKTNQHSVEIVYSDLHPSDYTKQREKARNWLLLQRKSDFGWGDETPRAITALYLSDVQHSVESNESDLLMVKQLEVQLALNLARNGTKSMKLSNLALYINALMAGCQDPKNFYGDDLVHILRNGVNALHWQGKFVNPSIYLTLCMNNASTYDDTRKLHDMHLSRNVVIGRMDIQALALLTTICFYRNTKLLPASTYDGLKMQFLQRMNSSGFPGNVYEAALLVQALQELKVTLPGLLPSILQRQQEDGSFGGILATYLVLPVLAGRSFLQINDHCGQQYSTEPAPIAVLQNLKRRKIHVKYALKNGNPPEITQTIEMQVAEGINFLDVMRLAQEINPKFSFKLDGNRDVPVVYSIGGIPNDAEKGLFWTLYLTTNNRVTSDIGNLRPHPGNIKQLIPHPFDEYVFWLKSI